MDERKARVTTMKFRVTTTRMAFTFGFVWDNQMTHEWRCSIVLGFLMLNFYWKKRHDEQ